MCWKWNPPLHQSQYRGTRCLHFWWNCCYCPIHHPWNTTATMSCPHHGYCCFRSTHNPRWAVTNSCSHCCCTWCCPFPDQSMKAPDGSLLSHPRLRLRRLLQGCILILLVPLHPYTPSSYLYRLTSVSLTPAIVGVVLSLVVSTSSSSSLNPTFGCRASCHYQQGKFHEKGKTEEDYDTPHGTVINN